jgi:hypothetical protein
MLDQRTAARMEIIGIHYARISCYSFAALIEQLTFGSHYNHAVAKDL